MKNKKKLVDSKAMVYFSYTILTRIAQTKLAKQLFYLSSVNGNPMKCLHIFTR